MPFQLDPWQVWDLSAQLNSLANDAEAANGGNLAGKQPPLVKFGGHKDEGYALDWSPLVAGKFVSGTSL